MSGLSKKLRLCKHWYHSLINEKQYGIDPGLHFPYPTHILTLWSRWKCFGADDGATPDKLSLWWICCSFVFWTNYSRGLCEALCVCLFIHLKDRYCSVKCQLAILAVTYQGCLAATCDRSLLSAQRHRTKSQMLFSPFHTGCSDTSLWTQQLLH